MKALFLISIILIVHFVNAQTSVYHPFPDSNATWCCGWVSTACISTTQPDQDVRSIYSLTGKTLINGNSYNILSSYQAYNDFCNSSIAIDTTTYYIRQDTPSKKVWMYNASTNSDTILFDFDLHVGDSLNASNEYWTHYFGSLTSWIVLSIDSILIDGQYRKQFNYAPVDLPSCISSMIEGIGPVHGLFYPPPSCFEFASFVRKFYQENQLLYGDSSPNWYACLNFPINVYDELNIFSVKLFPNPFHSSTTLKIENSIFDKPVLRIYDSVGHLIKQQILTSNLTTINRNDLSIGIYFYEVMDSRGRFTNGKFVIE